MVFYKGAFSYETLQSMPLPELYEWNNQANLINADATKASKKR